MGLDTLWDFGGQKWLGTMGCFELGRIQELRAGWALRDLVVWSNLRCRLRQKLTVRETKTLILGHS